jgi:hypothetical protein
MQKKKLCRSGLGRAATSAILRVFIVNLCYCIFFVKISLFAGFNMSSAAVTPNNMNGKSVSPENNHQQQLPQALQNLHRILQGQLANVNPLQLQQALQRHQQQQMVDAGRKQLEQMLQQLQVN